MPTELHRIDVEDRRSAEVLADELEEQGHVHGAVIRAALRGDAKELIAKHWSTLVGPVTKEETCCRWVNGCVVDVAFKGRPELGPVLTAPAMRGLRRLSLSGMADLTWVSSAPSLRELVVFTTRDDSLRYCRGARFPAVESLTLSLETGLELDALTTVEAPALRSLHTRVAAKHEWAFVRTLALTSWFGQVETWTHRPQSVEGLLALVGCAPVRARGGRGLVALCSAPLLAEVTKEMRSQLPLSRFELLPAPEPSHDPEASRDPAEVTPAPRWAPANFRELPPRVQTTKPNPQNYDDPRATAFGSGVPYSEHYLGSRFFTRCGWCGSDDTRCIYDTSSSLYSHFETMRYYSWESECAQCGMFTHSKATTIS